MKLINALCAILVMALICGMIAAAMLVQANTAPAKRDYGSLDVFQAPPASVAAVTAQ
jgi:hypothetical protein